MHRVKPHKRKPMYFVIMSSVFYTDKHIHEVYDLKVRARACVSDSRSST